MKMQTLKIATVCLVTLGIYGLACADEPARSAETADDAVSFYRDVRPIFQAHCVGCHQPAKRQGELDMTTLAGLTQGGESDEPAIVPGDAKAGTLLGMIRPAGNSPPEMPKGRKPLSAQQVELIARWIQQGANDDSPPAARPRFDDEHPPEYKAPPVVTSLDFSPDGTMLAVAGYHEVVLLTADGDKPVARLVGMSPRIESVKFSPNGKRLAVTGGSPGLFGEVQIWDVASRKLERSVPVTYDTVYGAAWSHDGKLVSFGCADTTARAIDASSGDEIFYQSAHDDWVLDTAFSIDSTHLVSVSRDRSAKLNVIATQRFVDNITSITPGALKGGLHAVARHPTRDELVVGGADGEPKIYRMYRQQDRKIGDDYNLIRKLAKMPGRVFDVAYSPDGSLVAAGSSDDGKGHVWVFQQSDGKLVAKMQAVEGGIYCVAFHADGSKVASSGFEGEIFLNEALTGKLVKRFMAEPWNSRTQKQAGEQPAE